MSGDPRILIIDDDIRMCRSLEALLSTVGCVLETSNSGREALQKIEGNFFDLTLLDLFLQDMTGFDIMDCIKENHPETFVIVITGNSSESATIEAIRKGAYDYIKKPFEPDKLIKTVENALLQRSLTKERNEAVKALQESEQRMRAVLRASPVGMGLAVKGRITWLNETFYKMLGYGAEDLLGKSTRVLYQDEAEYERVEKKLYLENGGTGATMVKTRWVKKEREILECMLGSCPLDPEDPDKGYIVSVNDISEIGRLEEQLQRAQKMEAIGTLAGGVAHDLNNILSGLVSYPELLLMEMNPEDPFRKPLSIILKSGEKAASVVQDLLTLGRRGVSADDVVNLNEIVQNYLKSPEYHGFNAFYPNVKVATDLTDEIPNIRGSETHIYKTLMNLVVNAAEAMAQGGTVTISTEKDHLTKGIRIYEDVAPGCYVLLKVSDTGVGISPEDKEKIFEPFYTKKKMGRSGSGLGMAVVWNTVKDHRGFVDVNSTEGEGSIFTLYFPATKEQKTRRSNRVSLGDCMGRGESILVVDDIPDQLNIACDMLQHLKYRVHSVSSGEEALAYLRNQKVDLLVLDMIMDPGMDGLDTYRKVLELHPEQKAVILSGYSETDRVREIQRLGAGPYVKKPFFIKELGSAVKQELLR